MGKKGPNLPAAMTYTAPCHYAAQSKRCSQVTLKERSLQGVRACSAQELSKLPNVWNKLFIIQLLSSTDSLLHSQVPPAGGTGGGSGQGALMGTCSPLGLHLPLPNTPSPGRPQGIRLGFGASSLHAVVPRGHLKLATGGPALLSQLLIPSISNCFPLV